jgi:transglutaminase-like putative cysteine protease
MSQPSESNLLDATSRPGAGRGRVSRLVRLTATAVAFASAALALTCSVSYYLDQSRLETIARREAATGDPSERAIQLLDWVYHNQGFSKNQGYFLVRKLGPTPVDVLERGGDCSDKSRLLSSMLRTIGISSTLALCIDERGMPRHTMVDARLPDGSEMLLDPIWNLYFPKPEGGYYGLIDLRRDPSILWRRLEEVTAKAPARDKIHRYNRRYDTYDRASTFNWNKNGPTRLVKSLLAGPLGDRVYAVPRPAFLEEPKLFLAFAGLGLALVSTWIACRWGRGRRRTPAPAADSQGIGGQAP